MRREDTLYSIAWRHDLDYRDLARWNNIGADFRITVGQVLRLGPRPAGAHAAATQASPGRAAPRVGKPRPPSAQHAGAQSNAAPSAGSPPVVQQAQAGVDGAGGGVSSWTWPTDRIGAPRPVPGGGILLAGRLGQDVRAASAGRVVYTGSGLRGYGNLIIIKHADGLLSAYAHNREMLVREGQEVAGGQVIAHMGEGGPQKPVLYFEIRLNGKPVDPLPYFLNIK